MSQFDFSTDHRAIKRKQFEEHIKAREAELKVATQRKRKRKAEEEREAIAKLRAKMIHIPNRKNIYSCVQIDKSDKPLTKPMSPRFSERLRSNVLNVT